MHHLTPLIATASLIASIAGADTIPLATGLEELRQMVTELQGEVADLKGQNNSWLNDQRADEIRGLIHDVLADADTRANLQGSGATAGYKGGWFITTADGNWKLKINGHLQARWSYNDAETQANQYGFEQRRTKLKFSGHIFDPSWTYKITATWSRMSSSTSVTEDAWIAKKFEDGGWFKVGQFKAGFLRENIVSSTKQLTVERSAIDNAFTYGWTQGLAFGWKNDAVNLLVQYTDGPFQSNTVAIGTAGAPIDAWIVRGEFRFGDANWKDFGYLTSKAGDKNGLLVGVAYQTYEFDTGSFVYGNATAGKSHGWTIDASLRGDGWNAFAALVNSTGESLAPGIADQDSSGWLIQGGFLVSDNVELFAQYQRGKIDRAVFTTGSNDFSAFRIGFNYWPTAGDNTLKWTTDIAWAQDSIADGAATSGIANADWVSSGIGWRGDSSNLDGQMLLRTQLQLAF